MQRMLFFSPLSRTTTLTWTATGTYPRTYPVRLGDLSTPLWSWNSRRYAAKELLWILGCRSEGKAELFGGLFQVAERLLFVLRLVSLDALLDVIETLGHELVV